MGPAAKPGVAVDVTPAAMAAAKLGMIDKLLAAIEKQPSLAKAQDGEGRTCLHYAAGYGHEECVERLLEKEFDPVVQDHNGDTALHLAATHGCPMSAFNLTKAAPVTCLTENQKQQRPADVAKACERGEVLNAMLLACSGDATAVAVEAMQYLLKEGAVPDTWAPNGSSALMLAASVDGVAAIKLLLKHGATIELQDALGRSALMFAAGNCAEAALLGLLAAGATLGLRDRRSRSVLDYAPEGSKVKQQLQDRLKELEAAAEQLQAALLAELNGPASGAGAVNRKKSKAKKGKKKQAVVSDSQAVLASDHNPTSSGHMPASTAEAPQPLAVDQPPLDPKSMSEKQHLPPSSFAVESAAAAAAGDRQTATALSSVAVQQVNGVIQDRLLLACSKYMETSTDGHCQQQQDRETPSLSPSSSSSSQSDHDSQQAMPDLVTGRHASAAMPEAAPLGHSIDQEVAVLSVLAGVAADPASALTQPAAEEGTDPPGQPASTAADQAVQSAEDVETSSRSASDGSLDVYDALREDKPNNTEDWQVVRPTKKAPSSKATHHDRPPASQQHGTATKGRDRLAESQVSSHEAGQEGIYVNGEPGHAARPVRRSSSQASVSSWASVETGEASDRLQGRPSGMTLSHFMKPSHSSKPPTLPSFKAAPPPPPGPPPSASQAASSSAGPQGRSAPAPEPRRNAWDQPLAGSRLSQSHTDPLYPLENLALAMHGHALGSDLKLGQQKPHGTSLSGNAGSAAERNPDALPAFGVASGAGLQADRAEAAPSSPALLNGHAGSSASMASADKECLPAEYPEESQHKAQIADLQEEVTALRGDVAHLFLALKAAESRHQQELAGVIIEAAQHQTKAVAGAVAKERAATAAMLQAAAAQQSAMQHRSALSFDSRVPSHLSRQRQQQLPSEQETPFTRSRLSSLSAQQASRKSVEFAKAAEHAVDAGQLNGMHRHSNCHVQDIPACSNSIANASASGVLNGMVGSPSADELREGFRRAVSAVPDDPRLSNAKADDLMHCSINNVLPHVASWGNLSNHSSSSNSGLLHSGLHDTTSRGLPTFEPISTPAGLFNSNGNTIGDKGSFPSYLASIWSSDAKAPGLSGSPNNHFEQPSLLNTHQ